MKSSSAKSGNKPYVLYEINIKSLSLILGDGSSREQTKALASGRSNYIIFEELVREFADLYPTSGSDHKDSANRTYEQKAFEDESLHPKSKDLFRCSASSTFAANNNGPKIKKLLEANDYSGALEICKITGYNKNDFYVFTNSGSYSTTVPFKYFILPKHEVMKHLDKKDPRIISRSTLLGLLKSKVVLV